MDYVEWLIWRPATSDLIPGDYGTWSDCDMLEIMRANALLDVAEHSAEMARARTEAKYGR